MHNANDAPTSGPPPYNILFPQGNNVNDAPSAPPFECSQYGNNYPVDPQPPVDPQQPSFPTQPGHPEQPSYPQLPGFPQIGLPGFPGQQPGFPQGHPGLPMPFLPKFPDADKETSGPILPNSNDDETDEDAARNSFSDKNIRRRFIRKVYMILSCQLLCTTSIIALFVLCKPVKKWVQANSWFYFLSYGVFVFSYFILACPCCAAMRRKWPGNFLCLALFTLALSYMAGTISSYYSTEIVMISVGLTTLVCIAISIFAIQTRIDFTLCSGLIFVLSIVFMLFGIACMIVFKLYGPNYILQIVYGTIATLMFSFYLIFDTQKVVGGKRRKHQLSAEEYIYGAMQLYVDMVQLLINIMSIVFEILLSLAQKRLPYQQ